MLRGTSINPACLSGESILLAYIETCVFNTIMSPFTLILSPSRFFQQIGLGGYTRKGLAVFAAATLSQVMASLVYSSKVLYEVALGPYSLAKISLFRIDYLVMSSLTTVFVNLVVLVGVGRILGRFLGKAYVPMKVFITAAMYLFTFLALVNVAYTGLAYTAPSEKYLVLGAEFRDVVFYDVRLRWFNESVVNEVEAPILYAREAAVNRVFINGSSVKSGAYMVEELESILKSTSLKTVLRQPQAPPHKLPSTIVVEDFSSSGVEAKNTVLTSVAAVLNEPGAFLVQLGLVRNFVWRALMSIYLGVAVQALHKTKTITTLLVMLLAYLSVTNLVPVLF